MEYIVRETERKAESDMITKYFTYGVVLPAVLAGTAGWGCYFAKKAEAAVPYIKKTCYASEAKK